MSESRADRLLAFVAWLVILFSCLQILMLGFGRDQGIYAVVGDAILSGEMPYRDAWDFKPPGIFVVYAAAQALFGKSMASVRILEVLGLLAVVVSFRRLGRTLFGSARAGLLGGALALLLHAELEFWHTGQPESFGGMLTVFALVSTTSAGVDGARTEWARAAAWARVGGLFGLAFLMKPPLGGGALPCALYLCFAEHRRTGRGWAAALPMLVVGAGSFAPILLCAAWFVHAGAWGDLRWTLFEFTPGYTALGWHGSPLRLFVYGLTEAITGFSYVLPAALPLAALLPRLDRRERGGMLLVLGIVLVQLVGITLQAKFFQYHYGATLPLLAFSSGLGLEKAWRAVRRLPLPAGIAFIGVLGVLVSARVALRHNPGTFWERSLDRLRFLVTRTPSREELDRKLYAVVDYSLDTDRRAARRARDLALPAEPIFVWGFEPAVYWFSERKPASRYLYDVPQRATWGRERARSDLLVDLARHPPRVVVVQRDDVFSFVTGDALDSKGALEGFPEFAALLSRDYSLSSSVEHLDLYRRR